MYQLYQMYDYHINIRCHYTSHKLYVTNCQSLCNYSAIKKKDFSMHDVHDDVCLIS